MNFGGTMQYSIGAGSNVIAVAAATAVSDPFDKSPQNPVNMSRVEDTTPSKTPPSDKLLERVRVAAADLAELACVQAGWRYVSDKNNTTVYELNGAVLPSTVSVASTFGGAGGKASDYYLIKGVTTVRADVDSILTLLNASSTQAFALRMNQIFSRQYRNAVVVDSMSCTHPPARWLCEDGTIREYSENDAYSVNWLALKAGSSDSARDFTIASYQDTFQRDRRGGLVRLGRAAARNPAGATTRADGGRADRLLGVHVLSSFNFKDIPELPKGKNTDRLHFRNSGFVIEETAERGVFRLSLFLSLMPVAATLRNPKKFEKWLQGLAQCVGNVALQVAQPEPAPKRSSKVKWKKSDHCMLCLKSFYAFRRCHHCRFCGGAVCNKCSGFVDVSQIGVLRPVAGGSSDHYTETRGCVRCIQSFKDDAYHSAVSVTDLQRLSRTGSRSTSSRVSSKLSGAVRLSHDDDEISMDGSHDSYNYSHSSSSMTPGRLPSQQPSPDGGGGGVVGMPLARDEFEVPAGKTISLAMLSKPPRDPKNSLSLSTVSTTQSLEELSQRFTQSTSSSSMSLPPAAAPANYMTQYAAELEALALAGSRTTTSSHRPYHHHDTDDDDTDDEPIPTFARSTGNVKVSSSSSHANVGALPPRPTVSSTGSGSSFKFSMMSNLSLHSEPELEPRANDSFLDQYNDHPSDHRQQAIAQFDDPHALVALSSSEARAKLFSSSAGPRIHSQKLQSRASARRPSAPYPTSSSTNEDEFMSLPPPAPGLSMGKNDMILLASKSPKPQEFVVFSESRRESIFERPGDGTDMIPLRF